MRLATFNVENMFDRPAIMNLSTWSEGKAVLEDFNQLTELIQKQQYSVNDKNEILTIMKRNKGLLTKNESTYIRLRVVRGKFLKKRRGAEAEIVPGGRNEWIGWFELKSEPIRDSAVENTARVIKEINADILCVVEADNRVALNRFNDIVIPKVEGQKYNHIMLIDGNDQRGIDVGIMTKESFYIKSIVSHVDDSDLLGKIFSRDCAEYEVITAQGNSLIILINHFKSKGYGSFADANDKRRRQSKRVREIYEERLNQGFPFVAIAGDLNDVPDSDPLKPLLRNGSNLIDVMDHGKFKGDGYEGTWDTASKSKKLDYILMSPKLADKVVLGGIERRGVCAGRNCSLFPHFPEIRSRRDAASDHAALWIDIDV